MMSQNDQISTPPDDASAREERRVAKSPDIYFNQQFDADARYLEPGQVLCGDLQKEMFVAVVGTGVLVTMYDIELKLGAMAYVLVPDKLLELFPHFDKADAKLRDAAIRPVENCIAEMKRKGAGKHRIQMRLIGGAKVAGSDKGPQDAGTKNYIFVREYITRKGLTIINEDLGGPFVRRVHFFPATGRAVRMMLRRASDFAALQDAEKKIQTGI